MTIKTRAALIIGCVVAFFIIAPAAILLARGYYFDLKTRQLVKTGVLVVKTDPKNAAVFLDGQRQKSTTPLTKRFLIPKEYTVEIKKPLYQSWKKRITIHPQLVTYLPVIKVDKIPLFLETPETTAVPTTTAPTLFTADSQNPELEAAKRFYFAPATTTPMDWQLWQRASEGPPKLVLGNIPTFNKSQIIVSPNNQIFLLLDADLYRVSETLQKLNSHVSYARWNNELPGLIYGDEHDIWLYSAETQDNELLTRSAQNLKNAIYNGATNYVFVAEGQEIKAIEIDPLGQPNVYTLAKTKDPSPKFAVNEEGTEIIYLDGALFVSLKIR